MTGRSATPGRGAKVRYAPILTLLFAAACSPETEVQTATVPIADGAFYGIRWGGTQVERFYSVARPGLPESRTPKAVLMSPEHAEPCDLGDDIWSYSLITPRTAGKYVIGAPSPARVLLMRRVGDEAYAATFSDINCQRLPVAVPRVTVNSPRWNLFDPDLTSMKMAFLTEDAALVVVDPWGQEQHEIAQDVTAVSQLDQALLLTEHGQLVKRDHDGKELMRVGSQVTQQRLLNGAGDFAYVDERGLFTVRSNESEQIGPADACNITPLDPFLTGSIAYFSPCDSRRLVIAAPQRTEPLEYQAGVGGFEANADQLFFTTNENERTQLWVANADQPTDAKVIFEREPFEIQALLAIRPGISALLAANPSSSFTVYAINQGPSPPQLTTIADGVHAYQFSDSAVAVQYDTGDIVLLDHTLTRILLQMPSSVGAPWALVFGEKATGFVSLTNFNPDTGLGRLELWLVVAGGHFVLADDVREFREVWWPERGILYATGGEHPGVRFARVDIPCENTSDTAWACGFN